MSPRGGGLLAAIVAGLLTLAYLLPFRSYGLNLEDEGLVLYLIQRVAAGQIPYVDFVTGYTPGYYYLSATLWRLAGDLPTLRAMLAVVHAATVAGLAVATARVASPALAVLVPLLYVAFIPVFPGAFCTFNIPYPAWFATLGWVGMVLALTVFVRARRRAWLAAATLAAAAALATKPNAGVFALAAVMTIVLRLETPGTAERRASAPLWWLLWSGVLAGPWVTFGIWPGARDAFAYLVPLSAALLTLPARTRTHRTDLAVDVAVVLGIFLVVSLPWLAFFWARLGTEGFLRDVLLLGSGAAQLYYVEYPAFQPWALLVTAVVAGLAVAGFGLHTGRLRPGLVVVIGGVAVAASVTAIAGLGVMPESALWSVIWQLESAGYPLVLATHVVGVGWLWQRRRTAGCDVPATLLLCALFMHLQLYPRADFPHLVMAAPLSAVFAAFLLERVLAWWRDGLGAVGGGRPARLVLPVAIAVVATVIVLRVSPSLAARWREPGPRLPFAVAPVGVERGASAAFADLSSAASRLAELVPPRGASLTFPAVDVALFLTGTQNPSPIGYFFPGRPDHREEAEIVDVIVRAAPAGMLTLNSGFSFFDDAPPYYFLLRRLARMRYGLRERSGRFDVLAATNGTVVPALDSTHVDERPAAAVAAFRGRPLAATAAPLLALATGEDASVRRSALTTLLDQLTSEATVGLETLVTTAGLERRREVLLLRTIRDTRDARAASYLFAAATRADPRVANEALGAMFVTRAQLIAARNLWAGSREPAEWPARAALLAAARAVLADAGAAPRATALAAHLTGVLGDAESVPLLRSRLAGDAATVASAADALVRLAPGGLACDLVALLARPEPELLVLMPTTVLALAEQEGPVRDEARACLATTLAVAGPAREPAIWVAAALGDAAFAPALRAALLDESPLVRRAAAWALGEMPSDAASGTALTRAVTRDPDSTVRRLAAGAEAKQRGAAPRAALAARPGAGRAT